MKLLLSFIFILTVFYSYAQSERLPSQTTIGKIAPMGALVAEITVHDSTYTFTFNDKKYTKIDALKTTSFVGDSAFNQFYKNIKSVFENKKEKDYAITFNLGNKSVTVSNFKSMSIVQAMILIDGGYTTLTEKQTDKLFGH